MRNVKVVWALPSVRASGGPLDISEIAGVELAISGDAGQNFTVTDPPFPTSVTETVFPDLAVGEWLFRGVVIDTAGRRSNPVIAAITIEPPPDETPPGELILELSLV
jgi:hypothetical protein